MNHPPQPAQPPYRPPQGGQPGHYGPGGAYPQQVPYSAGAPYGPAQGGGFGPPPPKKKPTGLWVGLSAVAAVVVALAITGFVAPGFFLSEDGDTRNTAGGTGQAGGTGDAGDSPAAAVAEQIASGFLAHDEAALSGLVCAGSEPAVGGFVREASWVRQFTLKGPVQQRGNTATVTAQVLVENEQGERSGGDLVLDLANESGAWCWKDANKVG